MDSEKSPFLPLLGVRRVTTYLISVSKPWAVLDLYLALS